MLILATITARDNVLSTALELAAGRGRVLETRDETLDVVEAAVQHRNVLLIALTRRRTAIVVGSTARSQSDLIKPVVIERPCYAVTVAQCLAYIASISGYLKN